MKTQLRHLKLFIKQELFACIFPVLVFTMLAVSHLFKGIIPRYDFMLIACLGIQLAMYYTKIETKDEILVICIFHLLGLMMELFEVHYGSWSYPEFAYTKLFGVPLYSGFMYASVASYLCQAWRRLDLQILHWPNSNIARLIGALIYLNFFTNRFIYDVRYLIGILILYFFRRSVIEFQLESKTYRLPALLAFIMIGLWIWMAENAATLLGAWKYAYQHNGWHIVNYQKK